jgi:hypothetical protein
MPDQIHFACESRLPNAMGSRVVFVALSAKEFHCTVDNVGTGPSSVYFKNRG